MFIPIYIHKYIPEYSYVYLCLPIYVNPNIFLFVFAKNFNPNVFAFAKKCRPNIFVFVFGPENCISHTLQVLYTYGWQGFERRLYTV